MSPLAQREYLEKIRARYKRASKNEKKLILDEFCRVCSYHRKYAIRLINSKSPTNQNSAKRGRKKHYTDPMIKKSPHRYLGRHKPALFEKIESDSAFMAALL